MSNSNWVAGPCVEVPSGKNRSLARLRMSVFLVCPWHSNPSYSSSLLLMNLFCHPFDLTWHPILICRTGLEVWHFKFSFAGLTIPLHLNYNAFASFCLAPVSSICHILFINSSLQLMDTPGMTLFSCSCRQKSFTINGSPLWKELV